MPGLSGSSFDERYTGHAIPDELIVFKERLLLQRCALLAVSTIRPLRHQQESHGTRDEIASLGIFVVHFFLSICKTQKILPCSYQYHQKSNGAFTAEGVCLAHTRVHVERKTCTTRVAVIFQLLDRRFVEVAE
jgi:hypothetical protein